MATPSEPGLYIVTLNNWEPISVNANDPRVADKAIKVTRSNCKFGKAKNLAARELNYNKTFGDENVNYFPIVETNNIDSIEKTILEKLDSYRIKGRTGRKNEWLQHISPVDVEDVIIRVLESLDVDYKIIQSLKSAHAFNKK